MKKQKERQCKDSRFKGGASSASRAPLQGIQPAASALELLSLLPPLLSSQSQSQSSLPPLLLNGESNQKRRRALAQLPPATAAAWHSPHCRWRFFRGRTQLFVFQQVPSGYSGKACAGGSRQWTSGPIAARTPRSHNEKQQQSRDRVHAPPGAVAGKQNTPQRP